MSKLLVKNTKVFPDFMDPNKVKMGFIANNDNLI